MDQKINSHVSLSWQYRDLPRLSLEAFRKMEPTSTQKPSYIETATKSAKSGALLGFTISYLFNGLSIIPTAGAAVIGALAGTCFNAISMTANTIHSFHSAFNIHVMERNIKIIKEHDQKLKIQIKNYVKEWKPADVVDLLWSPPSVETLLPEEIKSRRNYSATQIANYLWNKLSYTTLSLTCGGVLLSPFIYTQAEPYFPKLIALGLGFYGAATFITYSIPVGILLTLSVPVIKKISNDRLMSNKNYRETHSQHLDAQITARLNQFRAGNILATINNRAIESTSEQQDNSSTYDSE